jgi:nucleoside phosphorylase
MLLIHTALHAEARALIAHFNLKRRHDEHAFACYYHDNIHLVESGTGKTNAATSVGWLSAKISAENSVWLNIGMAGHASHDIGELRLAHHIEDQAKGHHWSPPILTNTHIN